MGQFPWYFTAITAVSILVYIIMIVAPIGIWISMRQISKQMRAQTALLEARAERERRADRLPREHTLERATSGW